MAKIIPCVWFEIDHPGKVQINGLQFQRLS